MSYAPHKISQFKIERHRLPRITYSIIKKSDFSANWCKSYSPLIGTGHGKEICIPHFKSFTQFDAIIKFTWS